MGNHFGGVMVSVLALSAVDHGFEPRSGQTNDYKNGIYCFSAKQAALSKEKEQRMVDSESGLCVSGATGLSADCCFSDLAL